MFLMRIARFLGLASQTSAQESGLRYADPSHNPKKHRVPLERRSTLNSSVPSINRADTTRFETVKQLLGDTAQLKELTLMYLEQQGRKGGNCNGINNHVVETLTRSPDLVKSFLNQKWIRRRLAQARQELKTENRIGYNRQQDVWYSKTVTSRNLTEKEQRFLSSQGLGPGWRNIQNELEAIKWLYLNFTPDEFENFCVAILNFHCKVPVNITQKRRISGADGGFDGVGLFEINGKLESVALQAKRYALDKQVGEDHCDRFVGALIKNGWRHGFIITTGTFSNRMCESVKVFEERDIWIELIDQNRLAKIMLERTDLPHGFGLHRTERGLIYINKDILRRAAGP